MPPPPFIIDSHIHLWDSGDIDKLAWCKPEDTLARRCTVEDYVEAVNSTAPEAEESSSAGDGPRVGYIFVECDRANDGGADWTQPLAEVTMMRQIIEAEGESSSTGSTASSQARCLAMVPWAPVHSGPEVLERYLDAVQEAAGPVAWPRVRGFRYVVQDKPHGTMLADDFVAGLRLLGRRGFVFELGIDQHRRGRTQMEETEALLDRLHGDDVPEAERVVLVVNHLAKPDLTVLNPAADRGFAAWRNAMFALGKASPSHVFVKMSGLFSEMPDALRNQPSNAFFVATFPWFAVLLAALGPSRLMFGSDWPVCTARYASLLAVEGTASSDAEDAAATATTPDKKISKAEAGAWDKWRRIVAQMCYMATLGEDDEAMIWAGTAVKAYGLDTEK
ncbi:amidohydrolase family protein [Grosmannia clavigera kw1407]|uniref:Amidohydrolase family protein n=1 Tax=Grosmannia clavigera (strain kw1407 / UAMH 11150) TaxID=655863 RepID=F0XDK1_GROCL|nr:amidohydrolase family protein [Grosmannia clavigera kw1407]EFX03907.1 amidohydrolase family protein [Grosmannia clavigera kw1407]